MCAAKDGNAGYLILAVDGPSIKDRIFRILSILKKEVAAVFVDVIYKKKKRKGYFSAMELLLFSRPQA